MAELKEEPEEEVEEKDARHSEDSLSCFRMPGAFHGSSHAQESIKPWATVSTPVAPVAPIVQAMTQTPECFLASPTVLSLISPDTPTTGTFEEPSLPDVTKRTRGPKSTLRFAHPIPTRPSGKHGILRPKVLLQLQQRRESSGFHRPLYDVLPANRFAPRTKIGQKIHRLHRGRDGLEADDLVVINAEDYTVSDTSSEEIEIADPRAVVGVISPTFSVTLATTVAELTLENIVWRIKAGPNGASYTLESQCDNPQIARWYVPKRKRNSVIIGGSVVPAAMEGRKFYFTTILPDSKQHPVIASMTETSLEVYDSYTSRKGEIVTDETTRKLIIMSAAWVFFMEGWSNNYKVKPRNNSRPRPHARANSLPVEPTRRRSIFTQSPSRSPSLQPTPIEGTSCSSSSKSFEATSLANQRLPAAFRLSEAAVEPEQDQTRTSNSTAIIDRQASVTSQTTMSDTPTQFQQAQLQLIAPTISPTESWPLRARAPGPAAVPRVRNGSNSDDRKRRSWGHHELRPRVSSLTRSMSHRLRRDRSDLFTGDSACDIPVASIEERSPASNTGVQHFRRISQRLRRLNLKDPDATNITAQVLRPFTPLQQSFAPAPSRPTTAKSIALSETITLDNSSPYNAPPKADLDFAAHIRRESLPRTAQSPITMGGLISAAQSTDTLPDPGQVGWWQQYDQFIAKDSFRKMDRNCSPVVERYSLEQSQRQSQETPQERLQENLQEGWRLRVPSPEAEALALMPTEEVEAPYVELPPNKISSSVDTEAAFLPVEVPATRSRRLSVWKGKLRSRLHV